MNSALGKNDRYPRMIWRFGRGRYALLPNWPKWYSILNLLLTRLHCLATLHVTWIATQVFTAAHFRLDFQISVSMSTKLTMKIGSISATMSGPNGRKTSCDPCQRRPSASKPRAVGMGLKLVEGRFHSPVDFRGEDKLDVCPQRWSWT